MKKFIVCYDLDRVDHNDNTQVRNHLKKLPGWQWVVPVNGTNYKLPNTTFIVQCEDGVTKEEVYEDLKAAIRTVQSELGSVYIKRLSDESGFVWSK